MPIILFSQRGKDGNLTITAQETWVNTYTYLTANANPGDFQITVDDNTMSGAFFAGDLEEGDLILIIQMHGCDVDVDPTPTIEWDGNYTTHESYMNGTVSDHNPIEFGQVLDYENAGNFEKVEVASVSGTNTIELNCALTKTYIDTAHVQIVRIPRLENLVIQNNTSIEAPVWSGLTGGIVALEVDNELELQGDGKIDVTGKGFRGGDFNNIAGISGSPGGTGFLGSNDPEMGGERGEGIYGYHIEYDYIASRFGRGAIANGGGGANYHNSGGGGGSNIGTGTYYSYGVADPGPGNAWTAAWNLENPDLLNLPSSGGGRGGYSHSQNNNDPLVLQPDHNDWGGDFRRISGGAGGHPLTYDIEKIFFGGGGGSGCGNDGYGGTGGRGGGIILMNVYGDISGTGSIEANGEKGENAEGAAAGFTGRTGDDGAGGGGGGGSIIIRNINPIPSSITLMANGGDGGDQNISIGSLTGNMSLEGPGGAGAGGMISFSNGAPNESVVGGQAGTTNSSFVTNFPVNGATNGAEGMSNLNIDFYDLEVENDTICDNGSTTLNVNVVGDLPTGATIEWFEQAYGGTAINSGNSFSTPNLSTNTSYYVGICPGTFRKEVQVIVSDEIIISGSADIEDETCAGNDGEITGLTASGGFGNLTYEWNGQSSSSIDLTNASGGTYTLTVTDENGCQETDGPYTINSGPGPSIDASSVVIDDETCGDENGEITGITATGSNLTYEWNGNPSATIDHQNLSAGSYTLTVTDDVGCTTSAGPFEVGGGSGPIIDDSNIDIQNEGCDQGNGAITGIDVTGSGLTFEWNGNTTLSADYSDLEEGTYNLVVTDNNGCTETAGPYEIENVPGPQVDTNNLEIIPESCEGNNGAILGIEASGANLDFTWNGTTSTSTPEITDIDGGNYTLLITDENGCSEEVGPYEVETIPSPEIDDTNLELTDETCQGNDGAISGLSATGEDLSYSWNGTSTDDINIENLSTGEYTLEITDKFNCTISYGPVIVEGESPADATISASADVINQGDESYLVVSTDQDTTNISISWSENGSSNSLSCYDCFEPTATPSEPTTYTANLIDENGCEIVLEIFIDVEIVCGEPFIPTIFSPNEDGNNDELCVYGQCISSINLIIFNRWGERVFQTESINECWDGKFRGKDLNTGTFAYKATGTLTNGESFKTSGNVTLVK